MADVFSVWGGNGADHTTIEFSASDYIGFSGDTALGPISQGVYQGTIVKTNATMSVNNGNVQSATYVSPTQLSLNGLPAVDLLIGNVAELDMPLRFHYDDDTPAATVLSDVLFFAFYGSVVTPPSGVTLVAFERSGAPAIEKDSVAGVGYAWHASHGIGGIGNALQCADQASAVDHDFFIAPSASPSVRGRNANITFRIEFDVT